jgi:hypothetical protein
MTDEQAGRIAHALLRMFTSPDDRVADMKRFHDALAQALQAAHRQGWQDPAQAEKPTRH